MVSPEGKVIKRMAPKVTGKVTYAPQNYAAMLQGFEGVVNSASGTAYTAFQGLNFPGGLAGKTGTASVNGEEPTSWFVGFGPIADPQYVVVSVINQGGYGADASAPVVRQIFAYLASPSGHRPGYPPTPALVQQTKPIALPVTATTSTGPGHHHHDHQPGYRLIRCRRRGPPALELPWPRMGGTCSPSGPRWSPCCPRSRSRPATSVENWGRRSPSTTTAPYRGCSSIPTPTRSAYPTRGLQILYEILNERDDAVAERAYAPWVDMEAAMRAAGVPLFSLENTLAGRVVRRAGLQPVGRAGLHQRPQPDRSGRRAGPRCRPLGRRPDRGGRRALRLQPRAPGRLRRRLRAGRRGGGGR